MFSKNENKEVGSISKMGQGLEKNYRKTFKNLKNVTLPVNLIQYSSGIEIRKEVK